MIQRFKSKHLKFRKTFPVECQVIVSINHKTWISYLFTVAESDINKRNLEEYVLRNCDDHTTFFSCHLFVNYFPKHSDPFYDKVFPKRSKFENTEMLSIENIQYF